MKVVLSWLREFSPVELSAEDLAEILNAKGIHVEGILRPWDGLHGVVVAKVLEVVDHPNSDTLCVARVAHGSGEQEVVVGVRNMQVGDLVPLAGPGARVPALPQPLTARQIRGVTSNGMLCSPSELGISADHGGILILPAGTPVGADVKAEFGLDDAVLDVEIEPNRPDLMSVLGVAREVSAATGSPLQVPDPAVEEGGGKAEEVATVEIRDLERCPRYLARVIRGVRIAPSPIRAQARLTAAGMRPLSNVVDATNYTMLERGQPLHPFDLALLEGSGIVVRRAAPGERMATLDDVERTLTDEDLVIADHAKAVAVAGVIGSASSEVSSGTSDVLLESAHFQRTGVLRTARRLGLRTEASMRFERGADPEAVPPAADRSAQLIAEWSGGTVWAGAIEVGEAPPRRRLVVRASRAASLLGHQVTADDAREAFARLGISSEAKGDEVEVEVPGSRVDLEREVDLIEEIARVQGYERIGTTLPAIRQLGGVAETYARRRRVRDGLVRAGLREGLSLSFASQADLDLMGQGNGVRLANPLSAEDAFLRTSLIPGLLRALGRNLARGVRSPALFEVGHVFLPDDPVAERESVALAMTGIASTGYPGESHEFDFFDAKGAVETLLAALGIRDWRVDPENEAARPIHPARSAAIMVGGERAGAIGELHPRIAGSMKFPGRVALGELDVTVIGRGAMSTLAFRDIPRFPPVRRDLAFVLDEATPAERVRGALVDSGGPLLDAAVLFDVFTGGAIPEGKKSLAFSVDFRAPDRTLTDDEAEGLVRAIVERLSRDFGAELRAG
jgi:phenylalanyl-tRNA synthetase beta chain